MAAAVVHPLDQADLTALGQACGIPLAAYRPGHVQACVGRMLTRCGVPDLPGLAGLPGQALLRYDGGIPGLTGALTRLALADAQTLATMSAAALGYAAGLGWPDIAQRTMAEIAAILAPARPGPARYPASTP
jgi:hypothetical protein